MKWIDLSLVADIVRQSKSSVSRRSQAEYWQARSVKSGKRGAKKTQYLITALPDDIKEKLYQIIKPKKACVTAGNSDWDHAGIKNQKRALIRQSILMEYRRHSMSYEEFSFLYNLHRFTLPEETYKYYKTIDVITLYRWDKKAKDKDYEKLLTGYGTNRTGAGGKTLTNEDKIQLQQLFLTTKQWTMAKCYRSFCEMNPEKDISYSTVKRFYVSLPPALQTLKRFGSTSFNDRFMPYISRNYDFPVMHIWCSDHHMLDAFVRDERGRIYRPWITAFQDMRSRKIVGYCLAKNPSSYTILKAFLMAVLLYGFPDEVYFDNGKDYRGKTLQGFTMEFSDDEQIKIKGIFAMFNIQVRFCWPYHGQSKPIERWFRTLLEEYSKTLDTFCGSNTAITLEEHKSYKKDVIGNINLTIDDIEASFKTWLDKWNASWKHTGKGMNGRTPDEVFNEGTKNRIKIEIPYEYLDRIFVRTYQVKSVGRNGISVEGIQYYNPYLIAFIGRNNRLIARRSLNDITKIKVYDGDDRLICEAYNMMLTDTGAAEINIRNAKHLRKEAKEHLKGHLATRNYLVKSLPELVALDSENNKDYLLMPPSAEEEVKIRQAGFFG
ncbi:MAG: transposase [Spirochaetes bacterium]|nr:transposase [Spirochaetota bacterium]